MTWDANAPSAIKYATLFQHRPKVESYHSSTRSSLFGMDGFVVFALDFGTGNANNSGKAVLLDDLPICSPIHPPSGNNGLLIF